MKNIRLRNQFRLQQSMQRTQNPSNAQANNFLHFQALHKSSIVNMHDHSILEISNSDYIRRKQKYSKVLKQYLDPRDQQSFFPFKPLSIFLIIVIKKTQNFSDQLSSEVKKQEEKQRCRFIESQQYLCFLKQLLEYISEMCENINSISFNLLNEKKLTQNQAKSYAAKSILQNIQSILSEIKSKLINCPRITKNQIQEILTQLTAEIDKALRNVFEELASYYPQAPAVGETARMREAIVSVNRSQDESNDLIFARNIAIDKYLKLSKPQEFNGDILNGSQNYTGFIIEVINAAINVTRQTPADQQSTLFQKFVQFSETLFCISQQKSFKKILNKIQQKSENYEDFQREISQYLAKLLGKKPNKEKPESLKRIPQPSPQFDFIKDNLPQLLQDLRKPHKYAIAQKIPNYVKPFGNSDIRSNNFHVNSSAILRIMTKWAQYLQQIFTRPEVLINQRLYDFKTINNQLVPPTKSIKQQLVQNVKKQYIYVKEEFERLRKKNTVFQGFILSDNSSNKFTYLKRFTQVRQSSSEINGMFAQFMHYYLLVLIHHLMKAGSNIQIQFNEFKDINLVVFKVSDLLRSKFQCNQTTFINVLSTLYLMDQSREMQGLFKLVRIKNKLNQKDNNILINYMFMGRVQCELQLSIQDMKDKEKNYYAYCHFLYELVRGKFGVITQCAIVISQHDPIISSSNQKYYHAKRCQLKDTKEAKKDDENQIKHSIHKKDQQFYMCYGCKNILTKQNIQLFVEGDKCNECMIKSRNSQQILRDSSLKELLLNNLREGWMKRIVNYSEVEEGKFILSISNKHGEKSMFKLFKVWKHNRELKQLFVQISRQFLSDFLFPNFSYKSINYFNVSDLKTKKKELKQLTYIVQSQRLSEICRFLSIDAELQAKIQEYLRRFQQFRVEKLLIKSIKFKNQIIDLRDDAYLLSNLSKIHNAYSSKKQDSLFYNRYKNLSFQNIKKMYLQSLALANQPMILQDLSNINEIYLKENELTQINLSSNMRLKRLNIDQNVIPSLNLHNNISLTSLQANINKIKTIDLQKNDELTSISMQLNELTQVNLGNNTNLTSLKLSRNKLQHIDLQSSINLKQLWLNNNNLSSINISNLINLVQLKLANNKLSSLDITSNVNLTSLSVNNNKLQKIDTSRNTKLKIIVLSANKIREMDLSNNTKVTQLWMYDNKLTQIDLNRNINLTYVNFTNNQLKRVSLGDCTKLNKLLLAKNHISSIDLTNNTNLCELTLSENSLQQIELTKNTKLYALKLQNNELTSVNLVNNILLYPFKIYNNKLQTLSFSYTSFLNGTIDMQEQRSSSCQVKIFYKQNQYQQSKRYKEQMDQLYQNLSQECRYNIELVKTD